jgi:hypothetical protein
MGRKYEAVPDRDLQRLIEVRSHKRIFDQKTLSAEPGLLCVDCSEQCPVEVPFEYAGWGTR